MTKRLLSIHLLFVALLLTSSVEAQYRLPESHVSYIKDPQRQPDMDRQVELRELPAWQQFRAAYPTWAVEFNEASAKPHRAYGPPINTSGSTPEERAMDFITARLLPFGIPLADLVPMASTPTAKHHYVHFAQHHAGIPVVTGHLLVKLDALGRVIQFGTAVHDNIDVALEPTFPTTAALDAAVAGLAHVSGAELNGLRILPVPAERSMEYHLVHEVTVLTDAPSHPGRWQCYVDAHDGTLLYRWNQITSKCHQDHEGGDAGADVQVNATVNGNTVAAPTQVQGLPDLRVSVNGNFLFTDADGFLPTGITGPIDAQFQLRGRWANVNTNNNTPGFTSTLNEGPNTVSFDASANIRQRSAYHFVNKIHKHMKDLLPSFTGMDFVLPTNIDLTTGNCNAFYNGTSINFYAEGSGCRSLATVGDVVYHEYGHGINDRYYQSQGSAFINGGMNEGYADVWAFSLSGNPILAQGWQLASPNSFIRRYDIDPKVYPMDLVGQVHADGEIIAGAWYDTHMLLGQNMSLMMELFRDAYPGLQANVANGQEGIAFRNVLIDALQADDDDFDITNGTPNGLAIVEAFGIHGITLLSNVQLQHTALTSATGNVGIPISATATITFPFNTYLNGVRCFYRVNASGSWQSVLMTNTGGNNYAASIPPQPSGSLIAYYVAVEDIFGQLSSVQPIGAAQDDPNLPYYILVGYNLQATEDVDFLHQLGNWTTGLPGDNATTGQWEQTFPIPSYSESNGGGVMVAPGFQTTPNGEFCWVTQNAQSPFDGMGTADVDGGSTSFMSGNINVTTYLNPTFTYQRWYVNNPPGGANPNADWWQVYVSSNGGNTWVPVENTKTSDRSWRRNAFRVADYVPLTSTFRIKFVASDSIRPGTNLDGGSLVEAAVDDIQLWDAPNQTVVAELMPADLLFLYPDPANDVLMVDLRVAGATDLQLEVVDLSGRRVMQLPTTAGAPTLRTVDVGRLADGQYVLRAQWQGGHAERRFTVIH
ncbi:MAG: hypothetical protein KF905_07360 [Flavobacteriales bacterium]|nr:hypothetical protein [Flavobacteriales bacterium]